MQCIAGFFVGPLRLSDYAIVLRSWLMGLLAFVVAHIIELRRRLVFALMYLLSRIARWLLFIGAGFAAVAHGEALQRVANWNPKLLCKCLAGL